jgi:shikimate dehydrogenase
LAEAISALPKLGFVGANVTVPHKEAALSTADEVTPEARRIGAVNTLVVGSDGRVSAHNTDAYGFLANMGQQCPTWRAADGPALVLGAGGAARAVCVALIDAGIPLIRISNRNDARAEALAGDLGGPFEIVPWVRRSEAGDACRLLVNTTVLGMTGQPSLDIALDPLPPEAVVCDIVYRPLVTPLLRDAHKRGLRTVDGLGMLLHQARPAFAAWFSIHPVVDAETRRAVAAGLADA